MKPIDHAEIIAAYLSRLTLADIEAMTAANRVWTHAALNYGDSAQDKARAGFYAAVCNAVGNLLPHDVAHLDAVITRASEGAHCEA